MRDKVTYEGFGWDREKLSISTEEAAERGTQRQHNQQRNVLPGNGRGRRTRVSRKNHVKTIYLLLISGHTAANPVERRKPNATNDDRARIAQDPVRGNTHPRSVPDMLTVSRHAMRL